MTSTVQIPFFAASLEDKKSNITMSDSLYVSEYDVTVFFSPALIFRVVCFLGPEEQVCQ